MDAAAGPRSLADIDSRAWLAGKAAVLLDCDGVLWRGNGQTIPGAPEFVSALRAAGKKVLFVTNNSTASRAGYVQKMAKLGIPATEDEIVSSSFAAAQYIKVQGLPEGKPLVYVIGERGVLEELALAGFEAIGPEDSGLPPEAAPASREEVDGRVGAVVVGMDKYMSYVKLAKASCFVRYNDGCLFVATNPDLTFPITEDFVLPGAGLLVSAMQATLGREPDVIAGKPSPSLMKVIMTTYGLLPSQCVMVGDRLDTDILFGNQSGMDTLLVMTGVTSLAQAREAAPDYRPTYWCPSVADLRSAL